MKKLCHKEKRRMSTFTTEISYFNFFQINVPIPTQVHFFYNLCRYFHESYDLMLLAFRYILNVELHRWNEHKQNYCACPIHGSQFTIVRSMKHSSNKQNKPSLFEFSPSSGQNTVGPLFQDAVHEEAGSGLQLTTFAKTRRPTAETAMHNDELRTRMKWIILGSKANLHFACIFPLRMVQSGAKLKIESGNGPG